jgi:hypothetical protein
MIKFQDLTTNIHQFGYAIIVQAKLDVSLVYFAGTVIAQPN